MANNRKKAEKFFLEYIGRIMPGTNNRKLYEEMFALMTDAQHEALVNRIVDEGYILPVFAYNMEGEPLNDTEIMEIGEELGVQFFQHLILTDPITGKTYKTPIKYLVLDLPVRRQSQHLDKKISLPDNNNVVDRMTGQATGESKGASISLPELMVLNAKGFESPILEMIKVRGGDKKAYDSMEDQIANTGGYSLKPIEELGSRPKATETLAALLQGMHIAHEL